MYFRHVMRDIKILAESLFSPCGATVLLSVRITAILYYSHINRPFVCSHICHPILLPYQPSVCLSAYLPSHITLISAIRLAVRISAILYYSHINLMLVYPHICHPILLPYQPYGCVSACLPSNITPISCFAF